MTPHLTALGLTLMHAGWQALLAAALYRLCDLCLTRLSGPARYRLGLAAMAAIPVMTAATFVYEELRLAAPVSAGVPAPSFSLPAGGWLGWIDMAWAFGVLLLSLRLIGGLWFIGRLRRGAQAAPDALAARFAAMARRRGLGGAVSLRVHPRIDGPFVTGVLRSIVYLPLSAVSALTPEQLDAVLSHELEHVLRRDYLWNLAQSVIEILFFFHPAVWWLGGRLREQRELICDDAALAACREPLIYATALLQLEETRRNLAQPRLAAALNGHRRNLFWRIARILDEAAGERPASPRLPRAAGAVLALPLAVTLLAVFAPPVTGTAADIADKPARPAAQAPQAVIAPQAAHPAADAARRAAAQAHKTAEQARAAAAQARNAAVRAQAEAQKAQAFAQALPPVPAPPEAPPASRVVIRFGSGQGAVITVPAAPVAPSAPKIIIIHPPVAPPAPPVARLDALPAAAAKALPAPDAAADKIVVLAVR